MARFHPRLVAGHPDHVTQRGTPEIPPYDIERLLGDDGLRARVAQAGRDLVRREFTMPRAAERTEAVYREAIERRRLLAGRRFR